MTSQELIKTFEEVFERCLSEYWDDLTMLEKERYFQRLERIVENKEK